MKNKKTFAQNVIATTLMTSILAVPVATDTNILNKVDSIFSLKVEAAGEFAGGSGTLEDPYLINDELQLVSIQNYLTSHFKLTNDINLDGLPWSPIGPDGKTPFKGTFDGDGHVIKNLNIKATTNNQGFFGQIYGATVKNIVFEKAYIEGNQSLGVLAAGIGADAIVDNVKVKNSTVKGISSLGGLFGSATSSEINNIFIDKDVQVLGDLIKPQSSNLGGVIGSGSSNSLMLNNISSYAEVQGYQNVGGIVGGYTNSMGKYPCIATNTYFGGKVKGAYAVGAFAGIFSANISKFYSTGMVEESESSKTSSTGGVIGVSTGGDIQDVFLYGQLKGATGGVTSLLAGPASNSATPIKYSNISIPENLAEVGKQLNITNLVKKDDIYKATTYSGWSSGDWIIEDGKLPRLTSDEYQPVLAADLLDEDVRYAKKDDGIYSILHKPEHIEKLVSGGPYKFALGKDIDFSGVVWKPNDFTGILDGENFEVRSLTVNNPTTDNQGLFARITGIGTVKNLKMRDINITGKNYVGLLAGSASGKVENVTVSGSSKGVGYVGGLLGSASNSINNVAANVKVEASGSIVGGLIGNNSATINSSYVNAKVKGLNQVGGLLGQSSGNVFDIYSTGSVEGTQDVGGLIGKVSGGKIERGYSIAEVIGKTNVGGLLGTKGGSLKQLTALNKSVTGLTAVGKAIGSGQLVSGDTNITASIAMDGMGTRTDDYHSTVTPENMLKQVYYASLTWDIGAPGTQKIWNIENGTTLPYLTFAPSKIEYDDTTGSWVTEEEEDPAVIDAATKAVEKAEGSRLLVDITTAQGLVNKLKNETVKGQLQKRLDDLVADMHEKAEAAVVVAEGSKTQADVDTAQKLVDQLPAGEKKTELQARLDALQAEIDKLKALDEATKAVEKAEDTRTKVDFDKAQDLVNKLPESPEKDDLQERLDNLRDQIEGEQEADLYANALAAVEKAEGSRLLVDINKAQALVNQLKDGDKKTALQARLDALQADMLAKAEEAVAKAEGSKSKEDIDIAQNLIDQLTPGKEKQDLQDRLDAIKKEVEDDKVEADLYAKALAAVEKAEGSRLLVDINKAQTLVDQLKNSAKKDELQERLDNLLADMLEKAEAAVVVAEGSKTQEDIDKAQKLVTQLPTGEKKKELQDRLDALKKQVEDDKVEADLYAKALAAVEKAEGSRILVDINKAQALVEQLKAGDKKDALQARLDALLANMFVKAEEAVVKAEGSKTMADVNSAQKLINQLPVGQQRTDLQTRLDAIKKEILDKEELDAAYDKALAAVVKAEQFTTNYNISYAENLVNKVKDTDPRKQDLIDRLEELKIKLLIDAAEKLVVSAEKYPTDKTIQAAQSAVTALPDVPKKQELQDRLDALQKKVEDDKEADLYAKALKAVEQAEKYKKEPYFTVAQDAINKLKDGKPKQDLQDRLNAARNPKQEEYKPGDDIEDFIDKINDPRIKKELGDIVLLLGNAEKQFSRTNVITAVNKLENLPEDIRTNPDFKAYVELLTERVNAMRAAYNQSIEPGNTITPFKNAYKAVYELEKSKAADKTAVIASAQTAVDKMPAGMPKEKLQERIEAVKAKEKAKAKK